MERSINDGLDYSGDAAVGSFFSSDYKRHDDLKQMLDSNRDNLKLEAMKRIIGMVAKGRDASDLFPAVVKNVVSKNTEVKKLVYVYLMRYAEEQQDLALLSISTFQRALKDPNQLIRASALRVLSSIRVSVIVPIVMLAIRDSSADMSPYVRKTAAHAIPKLYSLDPDQKDELVQILDKLLADKTTLVVGSAVMAFEEVCPERIDLIHKNFRKLCTLLVDVDEWGQVVILNMLTRYARTQFVDPNIGDLTIDGEEEDRPFYEDEDEEDDEPNDEDDEEEKTRKAKRSKAREDLKNKPQMDSDHRLLLKNSRPLLQSRNASVVMAVAQLYHHVAPKTEVPIVVKALIRLLRSHVEVQAVVLTCIAAMSTNRKSLFEPYMKSFYVRSSDPTQIKLLKLEILTNIANETNIPPILREFQTYISSQDKKFVAATIQAIGRCASNIKEVAETCLNGLVSLLSHRDPAVVGGAVVVAKTLLQSHKSGNKPVIAQLAKMVDRVTVAPARAAILWLLGEHCERLPNLPPDVLRKMAKSFPDEDDIVKLQIINLAAKLQLTNPSQTTLLCQYILNLAKYDQSYDIRDRARFIRHLLFPDPNNVDPNNPENGGENARLPKLAKRILLSSKPAPVLQSKFKDRDHFQLGSLSHFLNIRAAGYQDLPEFPLEAPDPSVRVPPREAETSSRSGGDYGFDKYSMDNIEGTDRSKRKSKSGKTKKQSFYSDEEQEEEASGSGSGSGSGTEDSESDSGSSSSGSGSSSSEASSSCSDDDDEDNDVSSDHSDDLQQKQKSSTRKSMENAGGGSSNRNPIKSSKQKVMESKLNARKVVRYSKESDDDSDDGGGDGKSSDDDDDHSTSSSQSSLANSSSSSSESEEASQVVKGKSKSTSKTTTTAKGITSTQSTSKVSTKGTSEKSNDKSGKSKGGKKSNSNNVDELLLDFDMDTTTNNTNSGNGQAAMMSSLGLGTLLEPSAAGDLGSLSPNLASITSLQSASAMFTPTKSVEVLNKMVSGGLQITGRFTRSPNLSSPSMVSMELTVSNASTKDTLKEIRVGKKTLPPGMSVHDFGPIDQLEPGNVTVVTLGIDFNDTTQGAKMEILWATKVEPEKKQTVTINAPIGELLRAVTMSEALFISEQGKLRGMNEHEAKVVLNPTLGSSSSRLVQRVYETANLLQVPSTQDDLVRFAGQTLSVNTLVLVTICVPKPDDGATTASEESGRTARVVVQCEKIVIGSMLLQELKEALK